MKNEEVNRDVPRLREVSREVFEKMDGATPAEDGEEPCVLVDGTSLGSGGGGRGGDSGTEIDTLPGLSNDNAIDDIEYLRNKMMAALRVPKAFLGYEEGVGSKATLAAEDVRFARTIERLQKILVAELITLIWFRSDQFSMVSLATDLLDNGVSNTTLLGTTLFTDYLYLFEIAGFILLLAIIVSISLTMRRREGLKRQIVSEQINIDQTKRMKLVDLKNERN